MNKQGHYFSMCLLFSVACLFTEFSGVQAQQPPRNAKRNQEATFYTDVPEHLYDVILGRPDKRFDHSEHFVLSSPGRLCRIWGCAGKLFDPDRCAAISARQAGRNFPGGGLQPNTRYYYRLRYRAPNTTTFLTGAEATFHTQRPPGSSFTFAIQADSHLDENTKPALYARTVNECPGGSAGFSDGFGRYLHDR